MSCLVIVFGGFLIYLILLKCVSFLHFQVVEIEQQRQPAAVDLEQMAREPTTAHDRDALAAPNDVKRIIGNLDDAKLLDIMSLRPTVVDVEEASLWLAGDPDVFGPGSSLKPVAGEIVAILTADDEEERQ